MPVGGWEIGVCATSHVADELHRLSGLRVLETADPPPGYSLLPASDDDGSGSHDLARLSFGHSLLIGSRSERRLTEALSTHLRSYLDAPAGVLRLRTAAVAGGAGLALVPAELLWRPGMERLLQRSGLEPVDQPFVDIDETGFVRVRAWSWQAESAADRHSEVRAWALEEPEDRTPGDAWTVARLATAIDAGGGLTPQTALERVAALAPLVAPVERGGPPARLVSVLAAALGPVETG